MHGLISAALLLIAVAVSNAGDTTVVLEAADIQCTLPLPASIQSGTWSMADYSSADLYSFRLDVPQPRSSENATAVSATYGAWLHVFIAAVPEFLNSAELLGRLMDLQQMRRTTRGDAPLMMTYSAQRMLGAAPADEIAIEVRDTAAKDSLFTLITFANRGKDVVLVVLRSSVNPRLEGSESGQFYRRLLRSFIMKRLFTHDTAHFVNPTGWRLAVPFAWKNKVTTRLGTMPFVPSGDGDDTVWNTLVVQLPLVQIEYFVTTTSLSNTALADYAEHIANKYGMLPLTVSDQCGVAGAKGYWYRTTSPRRGEIVETRYGIFPLAGRLAIVRLTGWEREMMQVDPFLCNFLGLLQIPLPAEH